MDFVVLGEGLCAFYNQNQLNLILLRPTLANRGRIADIAEIRLKNHTEKGRIEVELQTAFLCDCGSIQDRPELSDFDPDFPSCVRVNPLQAVEHRTIMGVLVTHSLHKPISRFRVTSW